MGDLSSGGSGLPALQRRVAETWRHVETRATRRPCCIRPPAPIVKAVWNQPPPCQPRESPEDTLGLVQPSASPTGESRNQGNRRSPSSPARRAAWAAHRQRPGGHVQPQTGPRRPRACGGSRARSASPTDAGDGVWDISSFTRSRSSARQNRRQPEHPTQAWSRAKDRPLNFQHCGPAGNHRSSANQPGEKNRLRSSPGHARHHADTGGEPGDRVKEPARRRGKVLQPACSLHVRTAYHAVIALPLALTDELVKVARAA